MSSAAPRPPAKGPRSHPRRDDKFSEQKEQREDSQRQERLAFTQLKRQMSVAAARKDCLTAVDPPGDSASGDERSDGGHSDRDGSENSSSDDESCSESPPTAAPNCHSAALARDTQRPSPVVIPPNSIGLTYLHSFLSADECVIKLSEGNYSRSTTSSGIIPDRTSHCAIPSPSHPTVTAVRRRISELTGAGDAQIQTIRVVRYEPGQQYQPHYDSSRNSSRPRSHTIFAYLNDLPDGDGGETEFTRIGVKFKPKKGDALLCQVRSHHLDRVRRRRRRSVTANRAAPHCDSAAHE